MHDRKRVLKFNGCFNRNYHTFKRSRWEGRLEKNEKEDNLKLLCSVTQIVLHWQNVRGPSLIIKTN